MNLYTLSIRRPVLAWVMSITIVLFGLLGFQYLGVREFPSLDSPVITVSTNYRGASADVIESQITEPLEETINGIAGIRTLTSSSREGRSNVRVEFELGIDLEAAANDVRDRVSRAVRDLPPDAEPPSVSKGDSDAAPIVQVILRSERRNLLELSRLADDVFVERLQNIAGVSRADVWGEKRYAMRLWLNPQKLAAYRLSPTDVRDAVARENIELPSGRIEGQDVELPVRTLSRLSTPEEFGELILKEERGSVVRLRDVGHAELGPLDPRGVLKKDKVPMVAVVLRPQPGANEIAIADEFYRRIDQIAKDLPPDVELSFGFDTSQFVRRSIAEVEETFFIAFALVILVIFVFLRDWRTTLIPVLAIPVSIIGAFFIMYLAGFTINVLTLLALVLAIGMVVDDAIVVLENIYSKVEEGSDPMAAGIAGTKEIFFAVIATTVVLVAVFLPILFLGGLTGRLFREFGVVLAGAVVISAFIALTLTPMLSSRLLKRREQPSWLYRKTEPFFNALSAGYRRSLESFVHQRWLALPILAVSLGLIVWLFNVLPAELAPLEDRSSININIRGPEGATFEYMDRFMDKVSDVMMKEAPERKAMIAITSPSFGGTGSVNSGSGRIYLEEPENRERSQQEIAATISRRLGELTEARSFVTQEPTIAVGRRRGLPVQFVIQTSSFEKLKEKLPDFLDAADADPTFSVVDVDLQFNKPELRVSIDRGRARDLGVSALDVAQTLQLALSEQRLGFFVMEGKQYEIVGQVTRDFRNESFDLRNLYVRSATQGPVLLDKLVTITEESSPPQRFRFDRFVSATISAGLAEGKTLGDGIEAMEAIAERVLDESFRTTLSGESRDFSESARSLEMIFLLALLMIYLALAAQFESFRDPLTIMLTVPLALAGALVSLWYFNQTINVFSQIGIVMLIGLVTKNGILIVEFSNQRKAAGLGVVEAVLEGSAARFRPVLMTSLSTVLGILPIALALGAGAKSRVPMGVAVVGGLVIGTFLTLYVVPAMYTYLTRREAAGKLPEEVEEESGELEVERAA